MTEYECIDLPHYGVMKGLDRYRGVKGKGCFPSNFYFGSTYMLFLKQELPIQVAHINGV